MSKNNKNKMPENENKKEEIESFDYKNFASMLNFFEQSDIDENKVKNAISENIKKMAIDNKVDDYYWVFLYDDNNSIDKSHANKIYDSIKDLEDVDIAMLISSPGGKIEPAYLISKTCKRKAKNKFIVSIPRKAKSAATLIALGAKEIHMGMMSELGPIDPQIGDFPALSMSNALEKIADTASKYPGASSMLAEYLDKNLNLRLLGYFERINESAVQYAERLLSGKVLNINKTISQVSNHLVNHYKDHSFVIDYEEAKTILGDGMIKEDTIEYKFGNDIYQMFDWIAVMLEVFHNKNFTFIGNIENALTLKKIKGNEE